MTEKELLVAVITHPAGYDVDLFGTIFLRPLEDGRFAVGRYNEEFTKVDNEKVYDDPGRAAEVFIRYRRLRQLYLAHLQV